MNIYDKKPREAIDLADADLHPTNSSNQTEPNKDYILEDECLHSFEYQEKELASKRRFSLKTVSEYNDAMLRNYLEQLKSKTDFELPQQMVSDSRDYLQQQKASFEKAEQLETKLTEKFEQIQSISQSTRFVINSFFPSYLSVQPPNTQIRLSDIAEMATLVEQIAKFNEISSNSSSFIIKNQQLELNVLRDTILKLTAENSELKSKIENSLREPIVQTSSSNSTNTSMSNPPLMTLNTSLSIKRKSDQKENNSIYKKRIIRKRLRHQSNFKGTEYKNRINNKIFETNPPQPSNLPYQNQCMPLMNIQTQANSMGPISSIESYEKFAKHKTRDLLIRFENICRKEYAIARNCTNLKKAEFLKQAREQNIYLPYDEFERLDLCKRKNGYKIKFDNNRFEIDLI